MNSITKREAAHSLLKTTNWNCAGLAFVLNVPRCEIEHLAIERRDRRSSGFSEDYRTRVAQEHYEVNRKRKRKAVFA